MNIRGWLYSRYSSVKGRDYFSLFEKLCQEVDSGISPETTRTKLRYLLEHCQVNVPYYSQIMTQIDTQNLLNKNPEVYLQKIPVLTKDLIRQSSEKIKSIDLKQRNYYSNRSGGSTGEPVQLIQDQEYFNRVMAIKSLYSYMVSGITVGEPEVIIWGAERDLYAKENLTGKISSFLRNTTYMNAFLMNHKTISSLIQRLNSQPPKLIISYAQAMYEIAKFAEQEQINIVPQKAIITTATTLYPWMRDKIESIFKCRVCNRYGSREVGDIACELPGKEGLWSAPWGNYIEIVDDDDNPVPTGVEGNILVTNLNNYAMPLVRYKIGDRGALLVNEPSKQILKQVLGRSQDVFKCKDGTLIYGEYFIRLLYRKEWIYKFQITQKSYSKIIIKIMKVNQSYKPMQKELQEVVDKCKVAMGQECQVYFEFVDQIKPSASGKYLYIISEI